MSAPIAAPDLDAGFEEWWQHEGFMTDPKVAEKDLCRLAWRAAMIEAKKHINIPAIPEHLVMPSMPEVEEPANGGIVPHMTTLGEKKLD